ncbi:MAG: Tetracycline resistance protein, class B [Chlamydiae bacterium]|nr:Tetracycline resistance protein, class B [Chlamydiota bacterium]
MKGKTTIWSRSFFPVLLTYFIDNFGLAIVYPIFTPFFLKPGLHLIGADITFFHRTLLLGLLIASFPLAQFFGAPLLGALSDRIGRKKVFLATLTGGAIGYLMTGFGVHFQEIFLLWSGRALTGFFAGNLTLCLAAVSDITQSKQQRVRNYGFIATIGGIGFVLAILTGSSLSNPDLETFFRPDIPFFVTAFFTCINLLLMALFFKESHVSRPHDKKEFYQGVKNIGKALRTKGIRLIYLGYFLFMLCWIPTMQFLSAELIHNFQVRPDTITLTFVFVGITWSIANFLINPILSHLLPPVKTFTFALALLSLFLFLTLIPHESLPLFLFHFFAATLCAALSWTSGLAALSLTGSKGIQGSILGVNQSIVAIASFIGPIAAGAIAGIDIRNLYLFTGGVSFLGAIAVALRANGKKTFG